VVSGRPVFVSIFLFWLLGLRFGFEFVFGVLVAKIGFGMGDGVELGPSWSVRIY